MWISARTATTLAAAALLLVMVAVAAPLMPRPHLPSLPEERVARTLGVADKFGAAETALAAPERVRAQRMEEGAAGSPGGARWGDSAGMGAALTPDDGTVARLRTLLHDARTVADPRAEAARPTWVVRLVRDDHRVDVMVDADHDRVVVAQDGKPVGGYAVAGLGREFRALGEDLFRP